MLNCLSATALNTVIASGHPTIESIVARLLFLLIINDKTIDLYLSLINELIHTFKFQHFLIILQSESFLLKAFLNYTFFQRLAEKLYFNCQLISFSPIFM